MCRTVRSPRLADAGDGPAVAVLDPVGGGEAESAVVAAGDDHISDAGLIPVGQSAPPMSAGSDRDDAPRARRLSSATRLAGGGEHDRVESGRSVRDPSGEGILSGGGNVADMNATVIKVEVERRLVCLRGGRVMLLLRRGW